MAQPIIEETGTAECISRAATRLHRYALFIDADGLRELAKLLGIAENQLVFNQHAAATPALKKQYLSLRGEVQIWLNRISMVFTRY